MYIFNLYKKNFFLIIKTHHSSSQSTFFLIISLFPCSLVSFVSLFPVTNVISPFQETIQEAIKSSIKSFSESGVQEVINYPGFHNIIYSGFHKVLLHDKIIYVSDYTVTKSTCANLNISTPICAGIIVNTGSRYRYKYKYRYR